MPERLQKILARHGLGSRREIERWITEGRITVNNKLAQLGAQFEAGDRVAIDRKEVTARLSIEVSAQVLMYHKSQGQQIERGSQRTAKPVEEVIAADENVVATAELGVLDDAAPVVDRLPAVRGSRWVPINPMHAGDSGLLLATNDGNLGFALTRRKRWIPTAYMVRVLAPGVEAPPELPSSVSYDDGRGEALVEFSLVEPAGGEGSNLWYRVELQRADRRAAVRALFESSHLKVSRMTQVAFGNIELPRDLPRGRHRALTTDQVASLYELAQLKVPAPPEPRAKRAYGKVAIKKTSKAPHKKAVRNSRVQKRSGPAPDRRRAPKK